MGRSKSKRLNAKGNFQHFTEKHLWLEGEPNPYIVPVLIQIEAHGSKEITVHWMVKALSARSGTDKLSLGFHIVVDDVDTKSNIADVCTYQYNVTKYRVPAELSPGHSYRVQVTVRQFVPNPMDIAYGSFTHTADLSVWELKELLQRAVSFLENEGDIIKPVQYFYRNKPRAYFEDIMAERGGIMEVYSKDYNGDPGCPINGKITGLFFNVRVNPKTGFLPSTSPFGDLRFVIPIKKVLAGECNIYFADFYCHTRLHYVTLVVTKEGSLADTFCSNSLVALPIMNKMENPFFFYNPLDGKFYCSTRVRVEILYTENIDVLRELRDNPFCLLPVQISSAGSSTLLGKPKNPKCRVCNLYLSKK